MASISENISKSGSFKRKSFENESDGYSDDFEEESHQLSAKRGKSKQQNKIKQSLESIQESI